MKSFFIIVLIPLLKTSFGWKNSYDQPFTFRCPQNMAISRMRSQHHNGAEDRQFDFECSKVHGRPNSCDWIGYLNSFDQPIAFVCPGGGVIRGLSSYHSNGAEDRRWKVYCCKSKTHAAQKCRYTGWLSDYDQYFDYSIPRNRVFHGFSSVHANGAEDRIWNLLTCSFSR